VALIVALINGVAKKEYLESFKSPFWAASLCLIWVLGIVASGRHNTVFAATLFVLVMIIQYSRGWEKTFYKVMLSLIFAWTISWHLAPNWKSTFARLTPMQEDSIFVGLYWPEGGAQIPESYPAWNSNKTIEEMSKNISPRVENKRVLWLVPGPGAAFGGFIYSYGIHGLSVNSVPVRGEKIFGDGILLNPPNFIVSSHLDEWDNTKWSFMGPDILIPWIHENYNLVWMLNNKSAPIYLWEKKTGG